MVLVLQVLRNSGFETCGVISHTSLLMKDVENAVNMGADKDYYADSEDIDPGKPQRIPWTMDNYGVRKATPADQPDIEVNNIFYILHKSSLCCSRMCISNTFHHLQHLWVYQEHSRCGKICIVRDYCA